MADGGDEGGKRTDPGTHLRPLGDREGGSEGDRQRDAGRVSSAEQQPCGFFAREAASSLLQLLGASPTLALYNTAISFSAKEPSAGANRVVHII
jgi:hypothetical protein